MKKYFLLFSLFILGLSACQKSDVTSQQSAIDDSMIQAYFKSHNVTGMTKDPSGLYYKIVIPGTDPKPTLTSNVQITYTNTFLNGLTFNHVAVTSYVVNTLIPGLQMGLVKIGTGGRVILYVPSALGYGNQNQFTIPSNSVLIYTVDLNGIY